MNGNPKKKGNHLDKLEQIVSDLIKELQSAISSLDQIIKKDELERTTLDLEDVPLNCRPAFQVMTSDREIADQKLNEAREAVDRADQSEALFMQCLEEEDNAVGFPDDDPDLDTNPPLIP